MDAIVTSIIAVVGTLLGSTVTRAFQQPSARPTEQNAHRAQPRQGRLNAHGGYAGLLVAFRQAVPPCRTTGSVCMKVAPARLSSSRPPHSCDPYGRTRFERVAADR
ncbi:hypothetical protein AB0C40_19780 [Streptomyces brevispora]|uniref:hypothetical protein n=1 Tax=Streptomyces brevispora TaxID=887462 RepID=UPI0033EE415B